MGGKAFNNTTPITLVQLSSIWSKLLYDLIQLGCSNISSVGSTFIKSVMGDIDIAVNGNYDSIYEACYKTYSKENVRKIGSNLVSISYPFEDLKRVQVDILIGNVEFLQWSHHAPKSHESKFKPIIRQLFINSMIQLITEKSIKEHFLKENEEYQLDIQRGLFKIKKEKFGKKCQLLKNPKIIERTLISNEPTYITSWIVLRGTDHKKFYQYIKPPLTFEDIFNIAIENLNFDDLNFVKSIFIKRFLECAKKSPNRLALTKDEIDRILVNILNYLGNYNVIK